MTSSVETSALQQAINDLERQLPELSAREESLRKELQEAEQRLSAARQALQHLRVLTGTIPPGPATTLVGGKQPEPEPAGDTPEKDSQAQSEAPAPADEAAATVPQPRTPAKKAAGKAPRATAAGKKPAADKAGGAEKKPATAKAGEAAKKSATDKAEEAAKKPRTSKPAAKKKAPAGSRAAAPATEESAKVASPLLTAALNVLQKHGAAMRPAEINTALGREDTPGQRESLRNTLERAVKAGQLKRPGRGQYSV
ncbi:hypothetical protein OEIGOIKO_00161 [Streptomyces chrestomyceticus JCM 4735]|uniref:Uncharacterized protein n=1 Tax=Streptomyces chrestomyceticus JCM 4735 TaxID=1306181 RepID=A0A7U9KPZ7_9ACTN|nr:hypothetical protein [Streptomyces chrestomyceticus]GCD32448.1 hypothetical protein OEIGOIKO_00161 [Streptomyces chrestomyceticus JCM 4735]